MVSRIVEKRSPSPQPSPVKGEGVNGQERRDSLLLLTRENNRNSSQVGMTPILFPDRENKKFPLPWRERVRERELMVKSEETVSCS